VVVINIYVLMSVVVVVVVVVVGGGGGDDCGRGVGFVVFEGGYNGRGGAM
jgi:hypothetical protein